METFDMAKAGRPPNSIKDNSKASSAEKGTKPGYLRKTYIVNTDIAEKIELIAYWDRKSIKEVVEESFQHTIKAYEKKNGTIKPAKK